MQPMRRSLRCLTTPKKSVRSSPPFSRAVASGAVEGSPGRALYGDQRPGNDMYETIGSAYSSSNYDSHNASIASRGLHTRAFEDTFGRVHDYLRISLTERCSYCMPEEGIQLSPKDSLLTNDEIVRLASLFVDNGVNKIRLTGGEPSIRKGVTELVARLNELRPKGLKIIAMTSNGLALRRILPDLVDYGLTHLNLSLDTLDPAKFERITKRKGHDAVLKTLDTALTLGPRLELVKLNVVVMQGFNEDEILSFVELTKHLPVSVRFIEFMPFAGNLWNSTKFIPSASLLSRIKERHPTVVCQGNEPNVTSRSYSIPGYEGSFGFISSMSDHFCGTCNRLRLTVDGQIKVCLFDGCEISLRDKMRDGASDRDLTAIVRLALHKKKEKHEPPDEIDTTNNRPMILIGGTLLTGPRPFPILSRAAKTRIPSLIRWHPEMRRIHMTSSDKQHQNKTWMSNALSEINPTSELLTHVDESGMPAMVDVSSKASTQRSATATGKIFLPKAAFQLVTSEVTSEDMSQRQGKALAKGPVLSTARIAGIMAAKQTATLIPLTHSVPLTAIKVELVPCHSNSSIVCWATVNCEGRTGVEMEALVAVNGALLCVWDMLKAVGGREMVIGDIKVVKKVGGLSGNWGRSA